MKNISYTLKHDLCTGCGVCKGACRKSAISINANKGNFRPIVDETKCNQCGLCIKACPGVGIDIVCMANELFPNAMHQDRMVGPYEKSFIGYSNNFDIRYHSASGGMVSSFLIWLLENNKIDGAVVTRFDKSNPLLVKTFIATKREEIIAARSSKYAPVTMDMVAQDINEATGSRYVIVGIPCHIQGMRKLMAIDKKLREKICGLFAIYCSSGRSFYLTEHVFRERGINPNHLSYFQYRDEGCLGSMVVKGKDGEEHKELFQSYYHPLRSFFYS